MECVDVSRVRKVGDNYRAWMERIQAVYEEVRQQPAPSIEQARGVLFDAGARTSERERMLLALIDHRDRRADALLEHRALSFDVARLDFVHQIARRRHRRRVRGRRRQAA